MRIHAYAFAPTVLQVFFTALAVLDPLVVVLLARARPAGVTLAAAVMAADVTANWIADWPHLRDDPNRLWHPVGLLPITLVGLFAATTTLPSTEPSPHARPGTRARSVLLGRLDEGAAERHDQPGGSSAWPSAPVLIHFSGVRPFSSRFEDRSWRSELRRV
ncbi:hypothetical protein [Actinomadura nitritigenes]|uniref:hypothetical protein n=1 Tax=Actinomadura nitritigenes TaxID=134602 RepID=UPI003D8DCDAD